jgi:hypothetical protein
MAFTVQDLDALDAAIKSGRMRVKYGDKEVFYQQTSEMLRARSLIVGELEKAGLLPGNSQVGSTSFASFGRD